MPELARRLAAATVMLPPLRRPEASVLLPPISMMRLAEE